MLGSPFHPGASFSRRSVESSSAGCFTIGCFLGGRTSDSRRPVSTAQREQLLPALHLPPHAHAMSSVARGSWLGRPDLPRPPAEDPPQDYSPAISGPVVPVLCPSCLHSDGYAPPRSATSRPLRVIGAAGVEPAEPRFIRRGPTPNPQLRPGDQSSRSSSGIHSEPSRVYCARAGITTPLQDRAQASERRGPLRN